MKCMVSNANERKGGLLVGEFLKVSSTSSFGVRIQPSNQAAGLDG